MLSPGEGVLTPQAVKMIGAETVLALNKLATGSGPSPDSALGGMVPPGGGGGFFLGGLIGSAWDAIKNIGSSVFEGIGDVAGLIGKGADWIKNKLLSWIMPDGIDGGRVSDKAKGFLAAAWSVPKKAIDGIVAKIMGSGARGAPPAAPAAVQAWVNQALGILHWPGEMAAGLMQQIMTESSGNPAAIQGAIGDINNATGNLARGIMQVVPTTFASNALPGHTDIMNPVDNIIAGARYAMSKYGPGWFAAGPQHSHGYDAGGWLPPGLSTVYNGTGRPEAVLTSDQWEMLRGGSSEDGRGPVTINTYMNASEEHIAAVVDRRVGLAVRL